MYSIYAIVILVLNLHAAPSASQCTFPRFLTFRSRWESQVKMQRQLIGEFWTFSSQTAESIDATKTIRVPLVYTCHHEYSDDRYILTYNDQNSANSQKYICFQFIHRTNNVIQIKKSSPSSSHDASMCDQSRLTLDPHPLVWPQPEQAYEVPDVFHGGFEFHVTDHGSSDQLCKTSELMPNWEADCMQGDGIQVDFRQFQCRANLEMQVYQKLHTLGSWNQGSFIFTIVTDLDELWPRLWMLKIPQNPVSRDEFELEILTTIAAVEATDHLKEGRYTFHLKRVSYPSLCANEAKICDQCEQTSQASNLYCQKDCDTANCEAVAAKHPCKFDQSTHGEWVDIRMDKTQSLNVTDHVVFKDDYLPKRCLDLKTELWYDGSNKKTLVTTFTNGCRPRYQCVEFMTRSNAVQEVQMSGPTVWPRPLPIDPAQICASSNYDDSLIGGLFKTELHPFRWKTLVRAGAVSPGVNCGLAGKLFLYSYMPAGGSCMAEINTCGRDGTSFVYKTDTCVVGGTRQEVRGETHVCLAAYNRVGRGQSSFVITALTSANGVTLPRPEYRCWLLHKGDYEVTSRVFLAPPGECHIDLPNDIMYRNFTSYYAHFDIAAGPGTHGSFDCTNERHPLTTKAPVESISEDEENSASNEDEENSASNVGGSLLCILSILLLCTRYILYLN